MKETEMDALCLEEIMELYIEISINWRANVFNG